MSAVSRCGGLANARVCTLCGARQCSRLRASDEPSEQARASVGAMAYRPHSDGTAPQDLDEFEVFLVRVADRLRTMPQARLHASTASDSPSGGLPSVPPSPPTVHGQTVAERAHQVAQLMAELDIGVEHHDDPRPADIPPVPRLADVALGDQIEVTGRDLLRAAADLPVATPVWWRTERISLQDALVWARSALDSLRRVL